MAITEEDRAQLGDLAMRAIDRVIERFGEDATLEDAVLIYEVSYGDPDHEGERAQEVDAESTTYRATVAGGIAQAYATLQLDGWERNDGN